MFQYDKPFFGDDVINIKDLTMIKDRGEPLLIFHLLNFTALFLESYFRLLTTSGGFHYHYNLHPWFPRYLENLEFCNLLFQAWKMSGICSKTVKNFNLK